MGVSSGIMSWKSVIRWFFTVGYRLLGDLEGIFEANQNFLLWRLREILRSQRRMRIGVLRKENIVDLMLQRSGLAHYGKLSNRLELQISNQLRIRKIGFDINTRISIEDLWGRIWLGLSLRSGIFNQINQGNKVNQLITGLIRDSLGEYKEARQDNLWWHNHTRNFFSIASATLFSVTTSQRMSQSNLMIKSGSGNKGQINVKRMKIVVPKFDNSSLIAGYSRTLIGRCMNPHMQDMKTMLFMLPRIWNVEERVAGADLGLGRFQFDFDKEEDIKEVMKMEPFHFDYWMLALVRWEPVVDRNYPSAITFWIRVLGVPPHFWADPTFRSIGEALGTVKAVDLEEGRVQVTVDGYQPPVFSTIVEFDSGEETTVSLRYERLFGYCRNCHSLCHDHFKCPSRGETEVKIESDNPYFRDPGQGPNATSFRAVVASGGERYNERNQNGQVAKEFKGSYKGKEISQDVEESTNQFRAGKEHRTYKGRT